MLYPQGIYEGKYRQKLSVKLHFKEVIAAYFTADTQYRRVIFEKIKTAQAEYVFKEQKHGI